MAPTPKELRELVEGKYGKETLPRYDGYLVIGRDLKIYRLSRYAAEIFGVSETEILKEDSAGERKYSIRDFLPGFMSGPDHDTKMLSAFSVLDDTIRSGEDYGTKNMGAKGGKIRKVPAKTIEGTDIEIWVELGPLFYEPTKEWFFVGFIKASAETPKTEIKESEEAKAVVAEGRSKIVSQVDDGTDLVGKKFLGVFGFLEENVFVFLPEVYRGAASFLTGMAIFGAGFTFIGLVAWHFWGPKPELRNYNIERPADRPVPPSPVNSNSGSRQ